VKINMTSRTYILYIFSKSFPVVLLTCTPGSSLLLLLEDINIYTYYIFYIYIIKYN
jgi:hypothetical protein